MCIFKDMRSIGPLRDRRGWIASIASKTGVAMFIYTLYRVQEGNEPQLVYSLTPFTEQIRGI